MISLLLHVAALLAVQTSAAERTAVGLASDGRVIGAFRATGAASRVLLIGGLDGDAASAALVEKELAWYERNASAKKRFSLTAIPRANPAKSKLVFPPAGDAYRENGESHALWRWIGITGPDMVIIAGADSAGLMDALLREPAAGIGRVAVRRVGLQSGVLRRIAAAPGKSEAHLELDRRAARTPREVADQIAQFYGHDLNEVVYIPAFALIARLHLGAQSDVERIVAPYVTGAKKSLDRATSSHFSGHLVFAELAERTGDARYVNLVRAAANFAFTDSGEMKESMPMHSQMSDSVFMGCPILVKAGKLTGERKYYDMALRHHRFMRKLDLRSDGLWRHSPLDEAAWGRGDAFALLGMALTLVDLPPQHEGFDEIRRDYLQLAAALAKQQDQPGMWRQVLDHDGSYRELSATCMIARALLIGVRKGWLDASYQARADRAWEAVKLRAASDGKLVDVCESTGAQKSLADYLHRKAILGQDPRGGAMVLLLAVEMAGL